MNAAELTRWAKEQLEKEGCRLNRVNNIPVRRRKGTIEKGWPDLQGYSKDGYYVAVEVKTELDRLSNEQRERLKDIIKCKGFAYLCRVKDGKPTLDLFGK